MSTKYDTGGGVTTLPPMTGHARGRYEKRLPDDAVEPEVAWDRGEDIQHPAVVETFHTDPPKRVRVYHHNQEYLVVFIVGSDGPDFGDEYVATVYNGQTHEHGPTRAYLYSHGPHYVENDVGGSI
ncbi:hypothetical protein [Natronoarchaeum rubrum]|uniref:hypothetical protein n=1 Tax=Natronoarchaeum rubrum TaxID=755311 RepID=UPI0021116418|nr:hypothetical protein [Natronoarchaeum rubrum]